MNMIRSDLSGVGSDGQEFVPGTAGLPSQAKGVFPRFYMDTVIDGAASRQAGKLVYQDVEMVYLVFAGSNGQTVRRKVLMEDQQNYPREYAAFKNGIASDDQVQGTPITSAPFLSRGQAETLRARNIRSVEELANLQDGLIMELGMGGRQLVLDARSFLQAQSGTADTIAMMRELEELRAENARLTSDNDNLNGQLDAAERSVELAASIAGRNVTPQQIQANFTPSPEDEPTDPAMDAMLLQANGLTPNSTQAAAAQKKSDAQKKAAATKPRQPSKRAGLAKVKELPVNEATIEAE
jgi:hypothetical protein